MGMFCVYESDPAGQQPQSNTPETNNLTPHGPSRPRRAPIKDLEPLPTAIIVRGRPRRLGHVQRDGPGMVHSRVEGEGELVAGLHGDGLGAVADLPADIAPQVGRRQIRHRAVLEPGRVGVAADVLPGRVLGPAGRELLEDVVAGHAVDGEGRGGGEVKEGLHRGAAEGISR